MVRMNNSAEAWVYDWLSSVNMHAFGSKSRRSTRFRHTLWTKIHMPLLQAWRAVDRAYYDKSFNGKPWFKVRPEHLH